jgi:hypothetical protein
MLNGSEVTPKERTLAERYYLSKFAQVCIHTSAVLLVLPSHMRMQQEHASCSGDAAQMHAFAQAHPRFEALVRVHGEPAVAAVAPSAVIKVRHIVNASVLANTSLLATQDNMLMLTITRQDSGQTEQVCLRVCWRASCTPLIHCLVPCATECNSAATQGTDRKEERLWCTARQTATVLHGAYCMLAFNTLQFVHAFVHLQSEGGEVVLDDDMKALSHYGLAGSAGVLLSVL